MLSCAFFRSTFFFYFAQISAAYVIFALPRIFFLSFFLLLFFGKISTNYNGIVISTYWLKAMLKNKKSFNTNNNNMKENGKQKRVETFFFLSIKFWKKNYMIRNDDNFVYDSGNSEKFRTAILCFFLFFVFIWKCDEFLKIGFLINSLIVLITSLNSKFCFSFVSHLKRECGSFVTYYFCVESTKNDSFQYNRMVIWYRKIILELCGSIIIWFRLALMRHKRIDYGF